MCVCVCVCERERGNFTNSAGRGAVLTDNAGQLICVGNDPQNEINCVGFNNFLGDSVFYVTVAPHFQNSEYKMLMGQPGPLAGQKWPCTVA